MGPTCLPWRTMTGCPTQADPNYPYTVVVDYSSGNGPVIESGLALYAWHPDVCSWVEQASSLDSGSQTVTATGVQRLGLFALRGETNTIFLPLMVR